MSVFAWVSVAAVVWVAVAYPLALVVGAAADRRDRQVPR
jgi:hypothetical protein